MLYQVEMIPSATLEREAMVPEHREAMDRALEVLAKGPRPWMASRTGIDKLFRELALTRNVTIEYTTHEERQIIVVAVVVWGPVDPDRNSLINE